MKFLNILAAYAYGSAKIHAYELSGAAAHYSIEINHVYTERITLSGGTLVAEVALENRPAFFKTKIFKIPKPKVAIAIQLKRVGSQDDDYDFYRNNCLHYCSEILQAGGFEKNSNINLQRF